ncbi:MAG: conjugal transfer protein TraI [Chitinophagaceae bacterium]
MRQIIVIIVFFAGSMLLPEQKTQAQIPIAQIIQAGIKKVIKAVDLKIQRLQNKTIWLQNAQKTLENTMSKLKLNEISDWVEKQRKLYDDYFQELWKVKAALSYYQRVKIIIDRQVDMVNEYRAAWALFRQDGNFTSDELNYMVSTYSGMMEESLKNVDQLFLVVNAFVTHMSDAKRLEIINGVADKLEENYRDLREFNNQNKMISLQRASERGEIATVKKLYGLP